MQPEDVEQELGTTRYDVLTRKFLALGFAAYNKRPKPERAHALPTGIYGGEPQSMTGFMPWTAPRGVTGIIPLKSPSELGLDVIQDIPFEDRANPQDLYGVSIKQLFDEGRVARVDTFRIAWTIMWPRGVEPGTAAMEMLPVIGFLHGVPMNRRAKYKVMRWLGRFAICVCWDMLGMGESDMPLEYGLRKDGGPPREDENPMAFYARFNRRWDWKFDIPYVHQLMTDYVPEMLQFEIAENQQRKWIFQADDWGTGIAMHYACNPATTPTLALLFLVNAVMLDGYFVIEIGTIGKLAELYQRNPRGFSALAPILPQLMVGIEKYMIRDREKMNRYTESDFLFPYINTDYQAGLKASSMQHNEWAILVLANRASRLAPNQLQPYHESKNPEGLMTVNMEGPVHYIWGMKDQMMPPAQLDRGIYLWPNAYPIGASEVDGADHFVEIDRPNQVVRIMLRTINGWLDRGTTRAFVGLGDDVTYKGDEPELARALDKIYQ